MYFCLSAADKPDMELISLILAVVGIGAFTAIKAFWAGVEALY